MEEENIMSKKQDAFYFKSFENCVDYACQAAQLLEETGILVYGESQLEELLDRL